MYSMPNKASLKQREVSQGNPTSTDSGDDVDTIKKPPNDATDGSDTYATPKRYSVKFKLEPEAITDDDKIEMKDNDVYGTEN